MPEFKKKIIKPVMKNDMVALNTLVPRRVKELIVAIGAGSPSKGLRRFCEVFNEELEEAAAKSKYKVGKV